MTDYFSVPEIRFIVDDENRMNAGTLEGVLMPYGTRGINPQTGQPEIFLQDSLTWPADGIVLTLQHDIQQLITRTIPYTVDTEVRIKAVLPQTRMAQDVKALVQDGTLKGLSVEFFPKRGMVQTVNGVREIRSARMGIASVVHEPAYGSTSVEVRGLKHPTVGSLDKYRRYAAWL